MITLKETTNGLIISSGFSLVLSYILYKSDKFYMPNLIYGFWILLITIIIILRKKG